MSQSLFIYINLLLIIYIRECVDTVNKILKDHEDRRKNRILVQMRRGTSAQISAERRAASGGLII